MNWKSRLLPAFLGSLISTSCGVYSFTGVGTAAKSISVSEFFNNTDLAPANLAQNFTNDLKDYYRQNTNITVLDEGGELQISGFVTDYRITPVAPVASQGGNLNDAAALSRFTITVRATFVNTLDESQSFKDRSFSFYQDISNDLSLSDVEEPVIRKITEQIILNIFNATVANW
jgi:hypothetical protein